ncbi:hypothetical protein NQ318_000051 [Aromia moschata]|uniref:Mos1 transposase HTH domain-containing protein n=1 Tax=Aromia moschata TaxID=1265417 RepID=A0AAV8YCE1_9CUCU|nr:hypothetical protein NQ318_000051 [Aromia moschata]
MFSVQMEQRVNLKFLVKLGKTFTEAYAMLKEVYGSECLSSTQVFEWFKRFNVRREMIEDDPRLKRPVKRKTLTKVNKFGDYPDLNRIGKLHNFLCQIIDNFNGTYGFIILATVTFTIIIIVNYTALLMAFTVFRIELDVSTDQINLLYVSFFWIVGSMVRISELF